MELLKPVMGWALNVGWNIAFPNILCKSVQYTNFKLWKFETEYVNSGSKWGNWVLNISILKGFLTYMSENVSFCIFYLIILARPYKKS